jgi:peptidoglycan hydrolase CwlO-like protein
MEGLKQKSSDTIEKVSIKATRWVGSTNSLLVHTALFIFAFALYFYGIRLDDILLVLTTIVSLEAIYLSIFIQMSVNRQARKLHSVARDVGEIQEDVDEIQKDVDEIQEDVDEIQKDVDEIQEDVDEIQEDVDEIQKDVDEIQEDVDDIQEDDDEDKKDDIMLGRIEETLGKLIEEVLDLKQQHIEHLKKTTKTKTPKK